MVQCVLPLCHRPVIPYIPAFTCLRTPKIFCILLSKSTYSLQSKSQSEISSFCTLINCQLALPITYLIVSSFWTMTQSCSSLFFAFYIAFDFFALPLDNSVKTVALKALATMLDLFTPVRAVFLLAIYRLHTMVQIVIKNICCSIQKRCKISAASKSCLGRQQLGTTPEPAGIGW